MRHNNEKEYVMTTFAIVDNEKEDLLRFSSLLRNIDSKFLVSEYQSIDSFLTSKTKYDFLLLDIELDNEDGIKHLTLCIKHTKFIIYISMLKERMQEAFSKNVIGFILKQDSDEVILSSLNKIIQNHIEKYITLKTDSDFHNFPISSIYKITKENRKIFVYLNNKIIRIYNTNLKEIYTQTKDYMIWIDRSIMINYLHITSFQDSKIIFDNAETEFVNTRRKKEAFNDYMQKVFQII